MDLKQGLDGKTRCGWVSENPVYVAYHDKEWGRPLKDDGALFEFLILEGMQAGLSWETILNKREAFQKAYDGFDPEVVASYGADKVEELMGNAGIIRNRLKIEASIKNAKAFLAIQQEFGSFSDYLWGYVDGSPIKNDYARLSDVPTETQTSRAISKDLKKRGCSFVGPTIIYALMQAVGMVDDHLQGCFLYHGNR